MVGALAADNSDQVRVAASSLQAGLGRIAAEESTRWLAFVPLESPADQVTQPSYAFDRPTQRACLLPPSGANARHLQDLAFQFDTSAFALSQNIASSSLALLITGSQARAAERALARFADVRDAARAAWLLAHEKPRAPASAVELTSKWVPVTLVQGDGLADNVQPVRGSDVRLEIEPAALLQPPARTFYGQILTILATPSPVVEARDGEESPEGRLARSFRVIARSWVQASFDVRYLLYLVALESLIPAKEDITEAVAEIGARLLATDVAARQSFDGQLRSAYNIRSRFVPDGELTAPDVLTKSGTPVGQLQELVIRAWSKLARNYFALAERNATGAQLEAVLADFRGKTVSRYAYGSSWADAVKGVLREA